MTASDEDVRRIGAYILGLVEPEEAARIEAELGRDATLRDVHATLADRLQELADTATPVEPTADLWPAIEARLEAEPPASRPVSERPAPAAGPAPGPAPKPANDGFWRGAAAAAAALLIIGSLLFWHPTSRSWLLGPSPVIIAVLVDDEGEPGAIVEAFDGQRVRIVPLRDLTVPADRTMQVWTKPDEEIGPVSLGLLPEATGRRLEGPALPPPQPEQLYEITIEPDGGSPTGRPTGPILLKGFAKIPR